MLRAHVDEGKLVRSLLEFRLRNPTPGLGLIHATQNLGFSALIQCPVESLFAGLALMERLMGLALCFLSFLLEIKTVFEVEGNGLRTRMVYIIKPFEFVVVPDTQRLSTVDGHFNVE